MTYWPGPGYRMAAEAHAVLRASDQDRDRAAEVLKAGFAEGRLTKDEYDEHLSAVYAARTVGDLATLTYQLPGGGAALLPVPAPPPRTNSMAVAALVCGLCEFLTFGLTAIPAVVLGHVARGQIRRTGESGGGLATAGLILGWLAIAVFVLAVAGVTVVAVRSGHGLVHEQVVNSGPGGPPPAAPLPGAPLPGGN
ncbi:MAG: DUF1707 and DUF4190 domain-containing protein [Streptosporangiaceae bacterium]